MDPPCRGAWSCAPPDTPPHVSWLSLDGGDNYPARFPTYLTAEGLTNREIATRLFVSLNTVKAHTHNICGKLGVHNRTQAVARARDLGVLPTI